MRTKRYPDSATGFLSYINSGTNEPTSTANATAPTHTAISTIIRLLFRYQVSGLPRAGLSEDTEEPEGDEQRERDS